MNDFGGRAMCPADEYDDPVIREEMVLHAVEEAFADAGSPPPPSRFLLRQLVSIASHPSALAVGAAPVRVPYAFGNLTLRATTDEHLGQDTSGLVDLTATLVPA